MELEIRRVKGDEEIAETSKIYIECWQHDYASFIPQDALERLDVDTEARECKEWLEQSDRNHVIAGFVDGRMVGYVSVAPHTEEPRSYDVEISGLFIRKDCRNKGYGLALLYHAVLEAMSEGASSIVVYNFKKSDSNSFYRSLDGTVVKTETQYVSGTPLEVECFGWDAADLLSRLSSRVRISTLTHNKQPENP